MRLVPGLMAKDGAEGVYVAALPDGRAVALKIADGGGRARTPVMVAALRSLGVDVAADAVRASRSSATASPSARVRSLVGRGRDAGPDVPAARRRRLRPRRPGRADAAAGDRREPVEVHVPRHRHVHRRRGRRRRRRSRARCSTPTATRWPRRSPASGCTAISSPTATATTRRSPRGCATRPGAPTYAFGPHPPPDPDDERGARRGDRRGREGRGDDRPRLRPDVARRRRRGRGHADRAGRSPACTRRATRRTTCASRSPSRACCSPATT